MMNFYSSSSVSVVKTIDAAAAEATVTVAYVHCFGCADYYSCHRPAHYCLLGAYECKIGLH